jgi:tetratricopeptide (TPR) repeat protein
MKVRPVVAAVIVAVLAVLAVKAAVLLQLGHHPLLAPVGEVDGSYYRHLGEMVARGDVFLSSQDSFFGQAPPAFFLAPLYIYFLGIVFKLSGDSLMAARAAQILLGTAGVVLLALSVRRWFGARAAWIAGALASGCGVIAFFEVLILPAALDPFLTALDLFLIARAVDDRDIARAVDDRGDGREGGRARDWVFAGAALGVHALNRPHVAFVIAGLTALIVWRRHWRPAALLAGAALVVIAPVTLRNVVVGDRFAFIATNAGVNVLMGNGPEATGVVAGAGDVLPTVASEWVDAPDGTMAYLRQSASWALRHPVAEASLVAKKTWYSLSATFLAVNHSYVFFARDLSGPLRFLVVGPAFLLPFGIAGLLCGPRNRRGYGLWAAFLPLTLVSVILVYVASRYRLPALVMCAGGAGALISMAIDRVRAGEASWLARPAAIAALVAIAALWPTRLDDGRAEEQMRMSLNEIESGRVAEGEMWARRAIETGVPPAIAWVRVGQTFETSGKAPEAIEHYKKALEASPKEPAIHFVLGRAYLGAGDLSAAVRELAGARVGPQQDAASRLLVIALAHAERDEEVNTGIHDLDPNRWDLATARQFAVEIANAGRVDLSIAAWERAAALSGAGEDYERLGLSWAMVGRLPESLGALQEAVQRSPLEPAMHQNFAVALARAGQFELARQHVDEALRLDPNYAAAQQLKAALAGR